jgi:hypothetical protein
LLYALQSTLGRGSGCLGQATTFVAAVSMI